MPICKACVHPSRTEIEGAMQAQTPLRTISDRFGISKTTLLRHKAHMIGEPDLATRAKALQAEAMRASSMAHVVQTLRGITALLKDLCERG